MTEIKPIKRDGEIRLSFDWEAWLEREERRAADTGEGSVVTSAAYQLMSGMVDQPHKALDPDWAIRAFTRISWARALGSTAEERAA